MGSPYPAMAFVLPQRSFLICLQLGIFCFIAREENIRRDKPSAGVTDAFGKELCLFQGFSCCRNPSLYFIRDKRISFGTFFSVFQRHISQNSWDGDTVNYLLVCYLTIPFLLLKEPDVCVCSWYLAEYPIHCVGVTAFV